MQEGFEVGVVTFEGKDRAKRLADNLNQAGAVGLVDEVGVIEHHSGDGYKTHVIALGATRGQKIGGGAVIGGMVGLLFGPVGFVTATLLGAGIGASTGGRDPHEVSLSDEFMSRLKEALPEDTSAVLVIGPTEEVDQVMGEIKSKDAVTKAELREALTEEQVAKLRAALEAGSTEA